MTFEKRRHPLDLISRASTFSITRDSRLVPWGIIDHSVVMAPPLYPFPVTMAMPPGTIPMYPSLQPYPIYGNQNAGVIPNPCSTYVPDRTPNTLVEQPSSNFHADSLAKRGCTLDGEIVDWDSRNKSSGRDKSKLGQNEDSNDVMIDLKLKNPGSTTDQDISSAQRKHKKSTRKEISIKEGSSSSRCSLSRSIHDSSSNSIVGGGKSDDLDGINS
ncbi:hypothetical protein Ddye_015816 [Dipteronia dyeriana]|uniref:Uncharacterized protein n=1 Tax=Dipteronia dyeriana TaxID=168575 RepID=A0AAD9U608_9ROSI|nr:hypothetical protein Ddye_015816 [Dipteronia dyeriana]